jgi:hypothetical protein
MNDSNLTPHNTYWDPNMHENGYCGKRLFKNQLDWGFHAHDADQ